jgi:hypothetical protein
VKKSRNAHDMLLRIDRELAKRLDPLRIETQDPGAESAFRDFLMAEYNNIANAHFNTVDSLANFIKHYLLIASAPLFLFVLLADLKDTQPGEIQQILAIEPFLAPVLGTAFFVISIFVLGYTINIRADTLLYARAVNGIRKYFYTLSQLTLQSELELRVLPTGTRQPAYFEPTYFLWVVLLFASIGTAYFASGLFLYWRTTDQKLDIVFYSLVATAFVANPFLYYMLARHREGSYLRHNIIGIDIDGVLNDHRTHFATYVKQLRGKDLDPMAITRMPVHEIAQSNITADDEHAVFNYADYWSAMPALQPSPRSTLERIRNSLGFSIWIFTHRPWPQGTTIPAARKPEYWNGWKTGSWWTFGPLLRSLDFINRPLARRGLRVPLAYAAINRMTRRWLADHGIAYDKLIVERGNTNTPDPEVHTRNRFIISRNKRIRGNRPVSTLLRSA